MREPSGNAEEAEIGVHWLSKRLNCRLVMVALTISPCEGPAGNPVSSFATILSRPCDRTNLALFLHAFINSPLYVLRMVRPPMRCSTQSSLRCQLFTLRRVGKIDGSRLRHNPDSDELNLTSSGLERRTGRYPAAGSHCAAVSEASST
jgi:hypothetical protein